MYINIFLVIILIILLLIIKDKYLKFLQPKFIMPFNKNISLINNSVFGTIYNKISSKYLNKTIFDYDNNLIENNMNIPKIIYQTYHKKNKIPQKVYDNIKKYAPNYKHIIYDDQECITFLENHYNHEFSNLFKAIKSGPHKADLIRYCLLYLTGGVYLDIKTELIKPIDEIFTTNNTYTVISSSKNHIYQGIIASKPKNQSS